MPHPLHILASGDDDLVKLAIFAVIGVFWVIGHLASWLKKAGTNPNARAMPRQAVTPPAIPALKQALKSAPPRLVPKVPPARLRPQQRQAAFAKRPGPPPLPPGARRPQPAYPQVPQQPPVAQVSRPAPAPRPAAPVDSVPAARPAFAASLNHWLQPDTLQKQFIITEIFQPPLGLRDLGS
jgi:hypothetical protein